MCVPRRLTTECLVPPIDDAKLSAGEWSCPICILASGTAWEPTLHEEQAPSLAMEIQETGVAPVEAVDVTDATDVMPSI